MANVLAGGDGMMGQFPLEQWFFEMPVCTRWWMTAALSASVLVQCRILNPFQLFYSFRTVFFRSQVSIYCPYSPHPFAIFLYISLGYVSYVYITFSGQPF